MTRVLTLILSVCVLAPHVGCTRSDKTEFWIYTSIYKDVISSMTVSLEKQFPSVKFQWFQSGSENVSARINAELSTGKTQADLILTSDPFWYVEAKKAGHLLPYQSESAQKISPDFRDPEHAFVVVRMPVAVIAYNTDAVKKEEAPTSWAELTNPKWKGKISMGSPMESGTSVLASTQLAKKFGWKYFEDLRKNEILVAGGNSAVVSRMETKERPVGILLLENVLDAQRRKSPVVQVYPTDGVILVPSPIAILKTTSRPELAKQVYDFFLSDEMQQAIVKGRMYSPVLTAEGPDNAKPFREILANVFPWNNQVLNALYTEREPIKQKFVKTLLN